MKNIDSILKGSVIALLTKVPVVKAMAFPVVMCVDVRARPQRRLSAEDLMLLNCSALEDCSED